MSYLSYIQTSMSFCSKNSIFLGFHPILLHQQIKKESTNETLLPLKHTIMAILTQLWSEKTNEFTTVQKTVIGTTLAFIFTTSLFAMALLFMEFTR